jgi:hypothetical protein
VSCLAPSGSVFLFDSSITHTRQLSQAHAFTHSAPIPPPAGPGSRVRSQVHEPATQYVTRRSKRFCPASTSMDRQASGGDALRAFRLASPPVATRNGLACLPIDVPF